MRAKTGSASPRPVVPGADAGPRPAAGRDFYHPGSLPERPLAFGQFLYYSRRISWRTLIAALVWQRQRCPRLGGLAVRAGALAPDAVRRVLGARRPGERFGDCAVRCGWLARAQVVWLVARQHDTRPLLGGYFVAHQILSAAELAVWLGRQAAHNATRRGSGPRRGTRRPAASACAAQG